MEVLSNLPVGELLKNGGAGIQIQAIWFQSSLCNHHILLLLMSKGMDKGMRVLT